jgi:small-conductance mechanosensitive channel
MKMLMKPRQWMAAFGLLGLVVLAVIGLILTGGSGPTEASKTPGHRPPLVDEQPLQTARALLPLAADRDEQRYAQQAEKLADHEVDLAFAVGLRDAAEHPAPPTPEIRELQARSSKAEAAIKADQDRIDQLKRQVATTEGARRDAAQQQLDFALVQLELDQDDLEDAKDDLLRSGTDRLSRTQRQFNRHEANEHALEASHPQTSANNPDINYLAGNLWTQFVAWRALRDKRKKLEPARDEALHDAEVLGQSHDALAQQVKAEEPTKLAIKQQATAEQASTQQNTGKTKSSVAANTPATTDASGAISSLHHLSVDQKDLADLNKRVQAHQEMAAAYASWIDLLRSRERTAIHGMIRSALLITLIVLAVYLAGRLVDRLFGDYGREYTRLRTLRAVIQFAMQAIGVLLILFVIFGVPNQMPTILGLAGAGLTVAMKDFIVGFFGWFVLMGRNGLRVGDWVEINGVVGEVVEINLLRTVLLETGNWADTGHPTGRKVAFVNSFAIEGHFFNFSTTGQWLWDEIQILVPSNQDPYPIIDSIQKMVAKETEADAHAAEQEWKKAAGSHRAQSVSAAPAVNLRPTTSGVEVHVRYITSAHERYAMRTRLYQQLVAVLHQRPEPPAASAAVGNKETPA